jgi:hypothetical protein
MAKPKGAAVAAPAEVYDVAISFLVADERTASAIKSKLGGLNVFFYPHNQEELIGTNGLESMRAPFLGARVNVVLFRPRYGNTPWTGVELAAIQDSCLRTGFRSLVFVQLDKDDKKPDWLPDTHIRCVLGDFTIDEVVGAIKNKVQENGGTIRRVDALTEAARVHDEASYLADRDRLMRDAQWIGELQRSIGETVGELERLVARVNKDSHLNITVGSGQIGMMTILRSGYVSLAIGWQQPIANYVGDNNPYFCHLWVAEYSGAVPMKGEVGWHLEQPKKLKQYDFKVDVAQDRTLLWRLGKEYISPHDLADRTLRIFLDLVSRKNQGKIAAPRI